jgi:UDP-glucose 4-epimerase
VRFLITFLKQGVVPTTPGGMPLIDARDVAAAITAALEPGRGPRRFMAGGHFLRFDELATLLEQVSGRMLLRLPMPGALMRAVGQLSDLTQRWLGVSLGGATAESTLIMTRGVPTDDARLQAELGIRLRPARESLHDALGWLCREGVLDAKHAPKLAP